MDAFPLDYVNHNLPLVVLSGIEPLQSDAASSAEVPVQQSGTLLQASSPTCTGETAQTLLKQFLVADGSDQSWNATALPGPTGRIKYGMKAVGRTYTLPLRKAAPLASSIDGPRSNSSSPSLGTELHSPLSPSSPGSPLYPDGIFTPLWIAKHQEQVPVLFVAFFDIIAASNINANQDEQLKSDINSIRAAIAKSGFKTKLAAVLISDRSILQAPELEDRLLSIRRATSLDSKSGLFFVPPMSAIEMSSFVQSMLTTLQPLCIDYYRDLTKHARRKKTRISPPPSGSALGGTVQPLSVSGWNVRYEVKQGVFAEFRQEMETADRHYSAAIDELFSAQGLLESNSTSSARWTEARLLCDVLALRTLRCQLWSSSTAGAAQSWINYRIRVADLLARRSSGLETPEWATWKARWAEIMAQLIDRADLPIFERSDKPSNESVEIENAGIYAVPEKPLAAIDRIPPMNYLHHSGYWLRTALLSTPLQQGEAVAATSENAEYKSNRGEAITADSLAGRAIERYDNKGQARMSELIKLNLAHSYFNLERFRDAADTLIPLWDEVTWRNDGWHDMFADLLLLLRQCALRLNRTDVVLGATYELMSIQKTLENESSSSLSQCLDEMDEVPNDMITLNIQDRQRLSPILPTFAFESRETHVGELLACQLSLVCSANESSAPLTLSSVKLHFGPSKAVTITHQANVEATADQFIDRSDAQEHEDGSLDIDADLTLNPNGKRIYRFALRFRDAQTARLSQLVLTIQTTKFIIAHSFTETDSLGLEMWFLQSGTVLEQRALRSTDPTAVVVLPKPPKVQLGLQGLKKEYYCDEVLPLDIELTNAESEAVSGRVSVQINGERDTGLALQWKAGNNVDISGEGAQPSLDAPIVETISRLNVGESLQIAFYVTAPPEVLKSSVEINFDYTLSSDKTAVLRKSLTLELSFVVPFEAKFNFGPLLYPDAWPSYFDPNFSSTTTRPDGIPQLWLLSSQVRTLAKDTISLNAVQCVVDSVSGDSHADTRNRDSAEQGAQKQGQLTRHAFEMRTQKYSLDDRRPTTIESTLQVTWSRDESTDSFTTQISVPRLTLPVSEPRVLCTLAETQAPSNDFDATLQYHVENPSTHFLTFALTMEASEDFAFSGPKLRSLSLAPMSRHKVEYCLALHDRDDIGSEGGKWIWPSLQVIDSYYQKTLRVHPAGDGVKVDEKGNIGVWIELS